MAGPENRVEYKYRTMGIGQRTKTRTAKRLHKVGG
jgi:hypothetical protein